MDQADTDGASPRALAPTFEADELQWGRLRDWAELVRLPNVFTVLSDSLAAAILVTGGALPWVTVVLVVIASVLAYWGGMILNDVVDLEEDRTTRSHRPLVRGSISPVIAGHIGNGMLLVAPIVILFATTVWREQPIWMGAAFVLAIGLSLCIRIYDSPIKRTPLAPLVMGMCRSLNILMAGTTMLAVTSGDVAFPRALLIFAAGIGLYIVGITVFARREEGQSSQAGLLLGLLLEVAGMALIAGIPWFSQMDEKVWKLDPWRAYPLLVGLVGLTVLNRGVQAVGHPVPRKVQLAVKHAILTIVLLGAAVSALSGGHWHGGLMAALLIPAMLIGSKFRST